MKMFIGEYCIEGGNSAGNGFRQQQVIQLYEFAISNLHFYTVFITSGSHYSLKVSSLV